MSPGETRALLRQLGIRPSKSLGQNFLVDSNIARKAIRMGEVEAGETIVEIGPGLGALTAELLAAGASVHAIEKDLRLYTHLLETLRRRHPNRLFLLHGDALEHPVAGLRSPANENFKILANLPYAISTPWLDAVLEGRLPERMVLMLQRETADRFGAEPGSKQYGAITVFLRSAFEKAGTHPVPRTCFYPPPDIDSTLLHVRRIEQPFRFDAETRGAIRACFGQRRKQIGRLLRKFGERHHCDEWLDTLPEFGLSSKSRPEEIPADVWQRLRPS